MNSPATTRQFGPLSEPVHVDAAGPGDPTWRDNAYLGFWSVDRAIFGEVHISTSPNSTHRFCRAALSVDRRQVEIIDPLEANTFRGEHIDHDLDGHLTVDATEFSVDLAYTPRFHPVDYSPKKCMGGLDLERPLLHYEQTCEVSGTVVIGGERVALRGRGFRDRTWGYRDEAKQWSEYLTVWGCFDDFDFTVMRYINQDGQAGDGFVMDAGGATDVLDFGYTYQSAGLFHEVTLELATGERRVVTALPEGRDVFWLPMSPVIQTAPALQSLNEFIGLECGGAIGKGLVGYGHRRHIG